MIEIDVLTIFPELLEGFLKTSLIGQARESGLIRVAAQDLRAFAMDRHRTVDDIPYGGGPGMVLKPEPLVAAIEALAGPKRPGRQARVILLSPQGRRFDQACAAELAEGGPLVLVCGRYEGVDQRVIDLAVDEELSIGDYVLAGGEVPAMVVIEAVTRLVPGVLGNPASAAAESFQAASLEGPQYTRPARYRGISVPEVLRSGDHQAIARWRREQALELTKRRRPDLLEGTAQGEDE